MGPAADKGILTPFHSIRLPNKYVDLSYDQNKNRYLINIINLHIIVSHNIVEVQFIK